jgi:hypothetical protein
MRRAPPRPEPSREAAAATIAPAVVMLSQRDALLAVDAFEPADGMGTRRDWRARVYRTLYQLHEPVFHWYVRRGWTWLHPIRNAARKVLLRMAGDS